MTREKSTYALPGQALSETVVARDEAVPDGGRGLTGADNVGSDVDPPQPGLRVRCVRQQSTG